MKTAELVMLQSWRKPAKLFSDFNTPQFACVTSLVMFIPLLVLLTWPTPYHHGSVDLARVHHPVSMPAADREDAMTVVVTRDGKVYFAVEQVNPTDLPQKIADRLKDHSVERKVYIKADMRARWGTVKQVLDAVHAAGLMRVAFLVDQKRSAALPM
ncbi:MAG TPA: biopolymer transporter ExbD [Candidatus Sulfotelmatobacter sp.]|nr:biopolymer transporter ExbD [Candidatus Sulfotelmatobacter sp.]